MNKYSYEIDKYIVGVDSDDEDGIVLTIATMENNKLCILRSCYGDNARFIDLLIKENQELKEMHKTMARFALDNEAKIDELENQQKEFIEYLENMIKIYNHELIVTSAHGNYDMHEEIRKEYKKILSKYKEIIGVSNDR